MNESSMMMPWRSFRDTFCALAVVVVSAGSVACSSDSGSSSSSSSSGSTAPANLRIFPAKIYSGFDGQNKYRVPAVVVGSASEATWSISDPALASLEPSIDGVILTTKKAGTAKLTVKISGVTATAEVTVNAYTPAQHDDGKARYTADAASGPACSSCHGPQKGAPDHTPTVIGQFTDEEVAKTIESGVDPLGQALPVEHKWSISDKEKAGLLPYLRSLDPKGFPAPGGDG